MSDNINNRLAFNIYVWTIFGVFILFIFYLLIFFLANKSGNKDLIQNTSGYFITLCLFWIFISILNLMIKPGYFEAIVSFGQIRIKSFNPNGRNRFGLFLMLFYNKYLLEHTIERQSFNDYRILIGRFGFKKSLILQKMDNGKLYESKPIDISLLGVRKYTDLILSIDRLKEKMSLN
jgi:hypothetical protein